MPTLDLSLTHSVLVTFGYLSYPSSTGREKELRQAIPVLSPHYSLFLCRIFLWSREDERR